MNFLSENARFLFVFLRFSFYFFLFSVKYRFFYVVPNLIHSGDVEKEIGRVCVQLASPDFKYMNGETLTLEGGMGLRP